ncbi:unnamed protein product [Lactuca virosa]|uniref:Alpha-soluble NSF attachment protein n=1 Tax=Lactuca virosa TaxID=75947 RepID=A0AAU9M2T9_9ASTR|nr:unnamed protein product [Lactuca virosa]
MRVYFPKGLNQRFSLSHSIVMGPTELPSQLADLGSDYRTQFKLRNGGLLGASYIQQKVRNFEKKADKKLNGWGFFGSKFEDAGDLYEKAANSYKLAKSWDQAGSVYVKLADCHLKMDSKHEVASAYADAAHSYKKTSTKACIANLEQALNIFMEIGRLSMAAR